LLPRSDDPVLVHDFPQCHDGHGAVH
jgi:hypothetical protein